MRVKCNPCAETLKIRSCIIQHPFEKMKNNDPNYYKIGDFPSIGPLVEPYKPYQRPPFIPYDKSKEPAPTTVVKTVIKNSNKYKALKLAMDMVLKDKLDKLDPDLYEHIFETASKIEKFLDDENNE